ncbi:uncharacterized protein LOC110240059 [Exaiptasia diaphana]|uniref:Matrix-remodeling-associated protein 7 helical domain-containing protein n=1 Tax=Exaiptasia diaphana TaxID=2652724 RepID=A0A913XBM6_EXADI|nr:uncharacterized protein LOC110240059 [Exaiptasia diaphana]KXJ26654.1 hypothetical protein AC249_AIPGENE8289 [Exaiptasia diaphana]
MELSSALLIPGALTVLVIILTWLYVQNANRLADEWSVDSNTKTSGEKLYRNPVMKEDEKPNQQEDVVSNDSELRAQMAPYLIDPSDIQNISGQIPLDSNVIEREMKEKGMENIQTYYKTSRLHIKEMEGMLSRQEREQERIAQRKQLEEIYKLMAQEKEKFGVDSMDQIEDQMRLYDIK